MSDDYDVRIEDMDVYNVVFSDYYQTVLFLVFSIDASYTQEFDYEMTYDSEENTNTVYVRARKRESIDVFSYVCAFDMTSYLLALRGDEKNVKINLKFKTGEEDGKDIYKDWSKNPLEIKFE